ncbi:MAG: hypothetical protein J5972_01405 [Eubacterium sp.]|nr:hypothetical protein [Eubacterium sp.]
MRQRIARFMYGRYGTDKLNTAIFILYIVLFVFQLIFRKSIVGQILLYVGYALIIIYFFRCFSRNIYKRAAENQKYLKVENSVRNYFRYLKTKFTERGGVKKIYRCRKCHQMIRVPKGKGKIAITCPKCRFEFIKRT